MTKSIPYSSEENEVMVLGCMLTNQEAFGLGVSSLDPSYFLLEKHRVLFSTLSGMHAEGKPSDLHLVAEELKNKERLSTVGGFVYLTDLAQSVGTSAHFEYYVDLLIENVAKRNLLNLLLSQQDKSLEEIKSSVNAKLDRAISRKTSVGALYQHLLEPCSEEAVCEEIRNTSPGIRVGMNIGEIDIELPGGAITIVASPTSHGKTTMLINQALGVLKHNPDKSVYFFSCEESMSAIMALFLNTYMGKWLSKNNRRSIDSFFRDGHCKYVSEETREQFYRDKDYFFESLVKSGRLNVHYNQMASEQLVQAIRFLRSRRDDIGAVFIDYMQLLDPIDKAGKSRQEQLKQICLMLKDCAVETGLPIVLGAQFNRQVTCEADLSPIYISEAGDIERIASLIIGFWNRQFTGFSREGNRTKEGNVISKPQPQIYAEILKGRKIGNGHSSVLNFDGNAGLIGNSLASQLKEPNQPVKGGGF